MCFSFTDYIFVRALCTTQVRVYLYIMDVKRCQHIYVCMYMFCFMFTRVSFRIYNAARSIVEIRFICMCVCVCTNIIPTYYHPTTPAPHTQEDLRQNAFTRLNSCGSSSSIYTTASHQDGCDEAFFFFANARTQRRSAQPAKK